MQSINVVRRIVFVLVPRESKKDTLLISITLTNGDRCSKVCDCRNGI